MKRAIKDATGENERHFLERLVKIAMGDPDNGKAPEITLLREVLTALAPPTKSTYETFKLNFEEGSTPFEQTEVVVQAVADGVIPVDVGNMFIETMKRALEVGEMSELRQRIDKLESIIGKD